MGAKRLFPAGSDGNCPQVRTSMNIVSFCATATRVKWQGLGADSVRVVGNPHTWCKIRYCGHDPSGIARFEVRIWSDSDRNGGSGTGL